MVFGEVDVYNKLQMYKDLIFIERDSQDVYSASCN
jgi:hypothetical protein